MKTPIFTGAATAIVTPFRGTGIDFDKMAELIDCQHKAGISCIVVCGTTGENATQPVDEHERLVDFCVQKNAGRMKIVSGVGSNDTMTSVRLAESAKKSGVDGILMVTPYYNKTTQRGLVRHFSTVADRVDLPMILYNVPSRTGIGIAAETYKTLSEHPNINGIKEASGDFSLFSRTRALCGDALFVWSGNDDNTIPMMAMGALGVISVASNIVPGAVSELCRLCLEKDFGAATELYFKYADLFAKLFIEVNPIPVKTAMNLMGMDVGGLRLPLCEMAPENLEKLKESLITVGIKLK
ncbi:MAG: 4-hydroxy-tetrahydrodipicolinate synthase [Oscillospiraceae bacterium]|jgi:4-hydroxy-tetrahydrodipicolinate synthase|nr:4-hydroxy-tetrahydrodipicolinate synthase [Oscillospiraceae bacterium]